MEKNYKLVLRYDGTRYDGWQRQGNTENTIQGKLESVFSRLADCPTEVAGAGRTDAGVHALAQVAHVHLDTEMSTGAIMSYANHYLPEDIAVVSVEETSDRFHSRLWAKEKTYLYRIEMGDRKDVFERKYIYGLGETLDVKQMKKASDYILGEHDFKSFCSTKKSKKSTVRTISHVAFTQEGSTLCVRITGDGFLYNMVRILMGTLIEVGQGKRAPESMETILLSMNRQAAGVTAPPEGLFLERIYY